MRTTPRVASVRLIGRDAELAALDTALTDAGDGRPSLVLLAGESGVGKTRLLAEVERRAREAGALVLAGDCVDLGAGELPYLPLVAALRPLARRDDPALTDDVRAAVAPLLPALSGARDDDVPAAGDAGQTRLFEGLLTLLDALGRERPVLLVVEDVHWSDPSTLATLAFLARNLTRERVLVIASFRSDELDRRHPLRRLQADLEGDPRTRRIVLRPLERDELADQLADILGAAPAPELLDRLWARTGGNPLFGEELLTAGADGRGAAPDTLRDALMLRVERLSAPARDVLALVAVGERLDHATLARTTGLARGELRDALREAVDRHLLVADDDGRHRFRHALLREAVEHDLLPGERADLHLTLARALEEAAGERVDAPSAAAVAHHFAAAGADEDALRSALRAASAAERVHAHGEAAALLERALGLWNQVPDPAARSGADRAELLVRAAEAAGALGEPERRLGLLEEALIDLGPDPDPARAARILESIATAQRHLNRNAASIATLEHALDLASGTTDGDAAVRADLLAGLARALGIAGRTADAARLAREALALATRLGRPLVESSARNTLGHAVAMDGAVDAGVADLRESIRIAREHDSPLDVALGHINLADALHALGRSAEAREVAEEGRRAIAGRRPIATRWIDVMLAEIAVDTGDWDGAEARLPAGPADPGEQTRLGLELRRAALALGRGDDAAAGVVLAAIEPLGATSGEPQALGPLAVLTAEERRRAGDVEGARAAVDRGRERIDRCGGNAMQAAAVAAAGVTVEADAAERARDLGDGDAEAAAVARAGELVAMVEAAATRPVERARLLGARAEAGRAAGRPDADAYAAAAAAWEDLGRPEPAARLWLREAEAHVRAGDGDAAGAAAAAARTAAERLGAAGLVADVDGLATRARLALPPADGGGDASPAAGAPAEASPDPFGLTPREREVLALVAEGATNREIGAQLFMAEKTASVHVSRILTKLNARTRTEAAAVAHRHGLASPGEG